MKWSGNETNRNDQMRIMRVRSAEKNNSSTAPLLPKMKLSETPLEQREGHIAYVGKRWSQLSELEIASGTEAIKYLLLVNSGAAVAVLAFLGTSAEVRALMWPKVMLGTFVLGVVFIGFYQSVRYHRIANIYNGWREGVDSYYNDKLDWENTIREDKARSDAYMIPQVLLAYVSFTCFLVGVIVGMCNFLDLQ